MHPVQGFGAWADAGFDLVSFCSMLKVKSMIYST